MNNRCVHDRYFASANNLLYPSWSDESLNSKFLSETSVASSLNYFLKEIAAKIRLTKSHRDKAQGHYEAVAENLKNSPEGTLLNKLDVTMLPFGGLGTNTASKPYENDEFDLDLVVKFKATISHFGSAERLYLEVFDRLNSLPKYDGKLDRKDRCVSVRYAGEFHLDLMPALPDGIGSQATALWIPEWRRDGKCQIVKVDPIGLMNWFDVQTNILVKNAQFEERANFEVMPILSEDARESALRQAVQLIKRMRD